MANLSPWIIMALVTILVVLLVKMHRLYGELDELKKSKQILELEVDKCRSNVRSLLMSVEKKAAAAERKVREAESVSATIQRQLSEVKEELANKVIAYDSLQKLVDEIKEELVVKKRELAKAGGEAQRYQNLFLEGNSKLTEVRNAYAKLQQQVMEERLKTGEPPASNTGQSLTKRQVTGEAAARERNDVPVMPKPDAGTQQDSLAAQLTKNQEQDPNYATKGQIPQQTEKQQEEKQQEAQEQQRQQQQVEGNKDDAGNERGEGQGATE